MDKLEELIESNKETNLKIEMLNEKIDEFSGMKEQIEDHKERLIDIEQESKNMRIELDNIKLKNLINNETDKDEQEYIIRKENRRSMNSRVSFQESPAKDDKMSKIKSYREALKKELEEMAMIEVGHREEMNRNRNAHKSLEIAQYIISIQPVTQTKIEHFLEEVKGDKEEAEKKAVTE